MASAKAQRRSSLRQRSGGPGLDFLEVGLQVLHDRPECLRGLGVRMLEHEWLALIAPDYDPRIERHPAQERQPELLRGVLAAADPENVRLLAAMRADEAAHVLDHAEDVHLDGLREGNRLADIQEGDLLGRRDDDRA